MNIFDMPSQTIEDPSSNSDNQELDSSVADASETQADTKPNSETRRFDIAKSLSGVFEDICEGQESKLHTAARCGMRDKVLRLLSGELSGTCAAQISCANLPCQHYEEETNHDERIKRNREQAKLNLNKRNRLGSTPLWLAAAAGHHETVKVLCEYRANLEIENIKGQTPLFAACRFNNLETVKALLKAGANPNGSLKNISTPIYIAARENYAQIVSILIDYGADVNGRNVECNGITDTTVFIGNVPLYITLVYQNYECFRLLILNGARLHVPSNDRGFGRSLVTAVLRHQCDVRYLKLIAMCGGIRHGDKKYIDEAVAVFRQFNHGFTYSRKECLQFIDEWNAHPMRLTQLCRISFRLHLKQSAFKEINNLTLPGSIKHYLSLSYYP